MEKKNRIILISVFCLIFVIGVVIGFITANKGNKVPEETIKTPSGNYAILYKNKKISTDVLDFTNRSYSLGAYEKVYLEDGILHFTSYYNDEPEDRIIKTKHNNIISVLVDFQCGGTSGIYYLTSDHEIYVFNFAQGEIVNEGNESLIVKDAVAMARLSYSLFNPNTTCGGHLIAYKDLNGIIYNAYGKEDANGIKKPLESLEYLNNIYVLSASDYNVTIEKEISEESERQVLKDESGKELVASKVFKGLEKDWNEYDENKLIIVIDENNNEYVINEKNIANLKIKSSGKVIKKIEKSDDGMYTFSYKDNTKKVYELQQVY